MGLFVQNAEQVRAMLNASDGVHRRLWETLRARTRLQTQTAGLVQSGDTQEWWHLVWERLSDAAFVQCVKPDAALAGWLRDTALELCGRPADDWIGPWFRPRSMPALGTLETAHAALAIATVIDLCPGLFQPDALQRLKEALVVKGLEPCRRTLQTTMKKGTRINNWFMVLLNGFGTAAAVLNDRRGVDEAAAWYTVAAALYNDDSYGESLQYSNYATLHLSHLREVLVRYDASLDDRLDPGCYARLMPWYAASFLYRKPLAGWGPALRPRAVNFGDSSVVFRPSGDVLLHVAARAKRSFPRQAGLARWLFDAMYADLESEAAPVEGASFGFRNNYQFPSLLLYAEGAEPVSPEQAELPLLSVFTTGSVIARDRWRNPVTVLAVQGGFAPLRVNSHRHEDVGSFLLAHRQERVFVDPGHCCYRLETQQKSKSTMHHNTWCFLTKQSDGEPVRIGQRVAEANLFLASARRANTLLAYERDGIHVIRTETAELYGAPIVRAERTWIAAMPHTVFIVDRIEAVRPVKVESAFVLNNRDNRLQTNVATEAKLVFRRGEAGVKLFQVHASSVGEPNPGRLTRDWGYVHDCYNPLPSQPGQGAEGSASIFRYTSESFRNSHTIVYALALDDTDAIRQWHIVPLADGHFYVEPPAKAGGYSLELAASDELLLHDRTAGKTYRITQAGVQPFA